MVVKLLASIALATIMITPASAANKVIGSFNGYCDGFSLKLKKNGSASGKILGCESGVIAGTFTKNQIYYAPDRSPPMLFVIDVKGKWKIYDHRGKIINKGKWSPKAPLAKSNLPSVMGK